MTGNAAQAGEGGAAGSSAVRSSGVTPNTVLSTATATVGKNGAAASASTDLSNTFATVVGSAGTLTV